MVKQTIKRLTTAIQKCDLIIANDIPVLPMALKLGQMYQAKVYIDAHEYEPLHYNTKEFNKYYKDFWYYICKKYLPKADYMTTVCAGIAEKYSKEFNVTCGVIINAPYFNKLDPVECSDNKIKLIHHGMAARGRQLENMIYLMDQLDDQFELHFMLVGLDSTYGKELHSKAVNNKIYFHDPVNMEEIPKELNKYDIGLYLLFPESYNQAMALPNKLFEFIQARLAIAIWPSQEMVKIIDTYKNGIYSKDFDVQQMAKILNSLTKKEIMDMKWNSNKAAKELNAEVNRDKLLTIVNNLIN
ncbi:hypothetical protein [Marispirochaeta sp.]|uniref:hypothetical protein n=1 Tax=Marispirochaeta sp. TaxID=2038653 RepID=UPI0029C6971A|nr:hypothetical protein [Marispirochaeta sp.]